MSQEVIKSKESDLGEETESAAQRFISALEEFDTKAAPSLEAHRELGNSYVEWVKERAKR